MSKLLLVTDIFGIDEHLVNLVRKLKQEVVVVDPYNGEALGFEDEKSAYDYFTAHVGLERFTETLLSSIQTQKEGFVLVGFSIGASAIWNVSEHTDNAKVKQALLFYGGQIRHRPDIRPKFDTHLIFPKLEKHFDVNALIMELEGRANVSIEQVEYLHGFMNPNSINYNSSGFCFFRDRLRHLG